MTLPRVLRLKDGKLFQTPIKHGDHQIQIDGDQRYSFGKRYRYVEFGYDSTAKQVYIDRSIWLRKSSVKRKKIRAARYVDVEAKELEVFIDKNSIEIFVNQGEASLTATYYLTVPAELTRID